MICYLKLEPEWSPGTSCKTWPRWPPSIGQLAETSLPDAWLPKCAWSSKRSIPAALPGSGSSAKDYRGGWKRFAKPSWWQTKLSIEPFPLVERPGLFRALSGCQALIFDTEPVTEMVRHAKRGSAFKTAAWRAPALWTLDTPGRLCYISGCAVAWCADRAPLKHFQSGRLALHHGRRKLENTSSSPSKSLAWEAPVLCTLDATLTGRGRVVIGRSDGS